MVNTVLYVPGSTRAMDILRALDIKWLPTTTDDRFWRIQPLPPDEAKALIALFKEQGITARE